MFGKKKESEYEILITVDKSLEMETIRELLQQNHIPCQIRDRGAGNYMRMLGLDSCYGIDIMVKREWVEDARKVIEIFEPLEPGFITDEELEEEALQAGSAEGKQK